MKQLDADFASYWEKFQEAYSTVSGHVFGDGNLVLAGLEAASLHHPDILVGAAVTGYQLSLDHEEAVCLMVILENDRFIQTHGFLKRLASSSLRRRVLNHQRMSEFAKPRIEHLKKQQVVATFIENIYKNAPYL